MFRNLLSVFLTLVALPSGFAQQSNSTMNETQIQEFLTGLAGSFRHWPIAPLYHWPEEANLAYSNVSFPSWDGVPLDGWFFPADSDKVLIMTHPRLFNRAGLPSHIEPFASLTHASGNDFDVNLIPDFKILHDAGYNILAYDARNHGHSSNGNGGLYTGGRYESRDVIGAIRYIRSRPDTKHKTLGLFPRCMGGNAVYFGLMTQPEEFQGIRAIVNPQPISENSTYQIILEEAGIPPTYLKDFDDLLFRQTSFHLDQFSPIPWARHVNIPTYIYQVHDDPSIKPRDVQAVYDSIPIEDKKLVWVRNTTHRWDGYLHFQRHPEDILEWLEEHMN